MPTVNGRTVDFAAMEMKGAGVTIATLESATYKAGREVTIHTDTHGAPLHWSIGEYMQDDVTLEFAKSDALDFVNGVEDLTTGGKLGGRFEAVISYSETDQPEVTDTLDLLFQSIEDKPTKSDGKVMVTVTAKQAAPMDYGGVELMPAASGQ